jgi:hypothetical protein
MGASDPVYCYLPDEVLTLPEPDQLATWKAIQHAESEALATLRSRLAEVEVDTDLDPLAPPLPPSQGARKL